MRPIAITTLIISGKEKLDSHNVEDGRWYFDTVPLNNQTFTLEFWEVTRTVHRFPLNIHRYLSFSMSIKSHDRLRNRAPTFLWALFISGGFRHKTLHGLSETLSLNTHTNVPFPLPFLLYDEL